MSSTSEQTQAPGGFQLVLTPAAATEVKKFIAAEQVSEETAGLGSASCPVAAPASSTASTSRKRPSRTTWCRK
jgi:hypothetical protein